MLEQYEQLQPLFCSYIKKILKQDKLHHAYLIETNGVSYGFDIALALSKSFLCPKKLTTNNNCNNCNICSNIDLSNYPDIKIIDSDSKVIKKEQLLELQDAFKVKPLYGKYLIYIIKDANLLNKSSANTILKFLEEPSDNIIAILVTNNIYNCIDTIVSRCQILSLKKDSDNIDENIYQKYLKEDTDLKEFISTKEKQIINFYQNLENYKSSILAKFNPYIHKEEIELLLTIGLYFYMEILNTYIDRNINKFIQYENIIKEISLKNKIHDIIRKIDVISQFLQNINLNVNKDLFIDNFIIEFSGGIYD